MRSFILHNIHNSMHCFATVQYVQNNCFIMQLELLHNCMVSLIAFPAAIDLTHLFTLKTKIFQDIIS